MSYNWLTALSTEQEKTLKYIKYVEEKDQVVSSKPISTTLNSYYLGDQHKISSGAENIFFTNETSDIDWYPMWGGIKDHAVLANRDASGIIAPSARSYGDYEEVEIFGNPHASLNTPYDSASTYPSNISGFGIELVVGEAVSPDIHLEYSILVGDRVVYAQVIEDLDVVEGDTVNWYFEHPVELHVGTEVTTLVSKIDNTTGENLGVLQVRQGDDGSNHYYVKVFSRSFADDDLAFKSDIAGIVTGSIYKGAYNANTDTPSLPTGSDELGDSYRVSVSGGIYEVGDLLIYNGAAYDHIPVKAVTQDALVTSGLNVYDIYVKSGFVSDVKDGSALNPFSDIAIAVSSATDGQSIYLDGEFIVTGVITLPSDKSLYFYGNDATKIQYATFDAGNDKIFYQSSSSCVKEYFFDNIVFANSADYAVYIRSAKEVKFTNCELHNNGWNGQGLSTTDAAGSGLAGYDSPQMTLALFWMSPFTSNGGAMRVRDTAVVNIVDCKIHNNLRGLRIQDCGAGGYGYISRNQCYNNIESGIYLASGPYNASGGCENFTVYNNASKFNANNGILVIGGCNNIVSLNVVEGNWNAGVMNWHVSNNVIRENYVLNNNRSFYNGIGNTGDAASSVYVAGDTIKPEATFITSVVNNHILQTGTGSSTVRIGFSLSSNVGEFDNRSVAVITVDNNIIQGQDYAYVEHCDLDKVKLIKGDNTYIDTAIQDVLTMGTGAYLELPYSNQHTNANHLDFGLDATGSQVKVSEGVIGGGSVGSVINYYPINALSAQAWGANARIMLSGSRKIQFDDISLSGITINGTLVSSVQQTALDSLNALFTNTSVFSNPDDFIVSGVMTSATNLRLTLESSALVDVDVTSLSVDEDTEVVSGTVSGDDLVLTMNDAGTVSIDISTLLNGTGGLTVAKPSIADLTYTVTEGTPLNIQLSVNGAGNHVTMWYATSAPPSWAALSQDSGAVMGTAPAYTGSSDTYTFTVNAANPHGSDGATITINVIESTSSTTFGKHVFLDGVNEYLKQHSNSINLNPLRRASNGDGRAWTVSCLFKHIPSPATIGWLWTQSEGTNTGSQPRLGLKVNPDTGQAVIHLGTSYNKIIVASAAGAISAGWNSLTVTFDGGTTGAQSGTLSAYYSRFKLYSTDLVTGVVTEIALTGAHGNYGFTGDLTGRFVVGANYSNNYTVEAAINYVGVTNSVLSSSDIGGLTNGYALDPLGWMALNSITDPTDDHIWLMGDGTGDVHPHIYNQVDPTHDNTRLNMSGMVAGDIETSDVSIGS